eukprot:TRINITY_DN5300_c0_g1_i1.p1 TRINITY_DN5300_c0_g1~~TRINITY_DN5300_c0_g1_i1.p1  ORF type:complete len:680 (+),score=213.92 TRINITY_DN5300_c0_g1_i1:55-2094(+)
MANQFEKIMNNDVLGHIFSFSKQNERIPFLFVNKRWRDVAQRKRREISEWRGMNFQKAISISSKDEIEWDWFSHFAARTGSLPLLKWSFDMGCRFDRKRLSEEMICSGNVSLLKWGLKEILKVESNQQWIDKDVNEYDLQSWTRSLGSQGHLEMIQFLAKIENKEMEYALESAFQGAISDEKYETVTWLLSHHIKDLDRCTGEIYLNLESCKWLKKNLPEEMDWEEFVGTCVPHGGNISFSKKLNMEFLMWLVSNEIKQFVEEIAGEDHDPSNHPFVYSALEHGYMDVLEYLEQNDLIYNCRDNFAYDLADNDWIMSPAIRSRNLDMIKWAFERFIRPKDDGWAEVGKWGSIPAFDYLHRLDDEYEISPDEVEILLLNSCIHKNWELVQYAKEKGFCLGKKEPNNWTRNIYQFDVESLEGAIGFGLILDERLSEGLAKSTKNWRLFEYLIKKKECPWDPKVCAQIAREKGSIGLLKWIQHFTQDKQLPIITEEEEENVSEGEEEEGEENEEVEEDENEVQMEEKQQVEDQISESEEEEESILLYIWGELGGDEKRTITQSKKKGVKVTHVKNEEDAQAFLSSNLKLKQSNRFRIVVNRWQEKFVKQIRKEGWNSPVMIFTSVENKDQAMNDFGEMVGIHVAVSVKEMNPFCSMVPLPEEENEEESDEEKNELPTKKRKL